MAGPNRIMTEPIEFLDEILKSLLRKHESNALTKFTPGWSQTWGPKEDGNKLLPENIREDVQQNTSAYVNKDDFYLALDYLVEKEMVDVSLDGASRKKYNITFSGRSILQMEGGYSGRLEKENRDKISALNNERNTRYGVVGAAFFAGCLLLWEILKSLNEKNQIMTYLLLYLLAILAYNLIRKIS